MITRFRTIECVNNSDPTEIVRATYNYSLTVDTTNPTITIDYPTAINYSSATQELNVSSNENIDTWWYTNDTGDTNTTFSPNISRVWDEGSNTVIVYGNDSAGNIGSN